MSEHVFWCPSKLAAQRRVRRRSTYYRTLNLWPFVSVMLALLLPYIVIVPDAWNGRKPVALTFKPHATFQPDALREDAVIVSLTRDGNVFLGNSQVQIFDLGPQAAAALRATDMKKVFVRADARARYGDVKAVVEQLRLAGVAQVCFLTGY